MIATRPATAPVTAPSSEGRLWWICSTIDQLTAAAAVRAMRQLLLLEDCDGRAPIHDMCRSCGEQYWRCLGLLGSAEGAGGAEPPPCVCGGRCGEAREGRTVGSGGWGDGLYMPPHNLECVCGGVVWKAAVEQSLRVCSVVAPDAVRACGGRGACWGG